MLRSSHPTARGRLRADVGAVVVLPPPLTGMTAATERLVAHMGAGLVVELEAVRRPAGSSIPWPAIKYLGLWVRLARSLGPRGPRVIYLVAESDRGLWSTLLMVGLCRLARRTTVVHHHVHAYVDRRDRRMAAIVRVAPAALHVVLCECMGRTFAERYRARRVISLSNAALIDDGEPVPSPSPDHGHPTTSGPLVVGMLGNLTEAKGLAAAIDAVGAVVADGADVRLRLAGPLADGRAEQLLADARSADLPVEHLGPVHGDEKVAYLASLDGLLFPSTYANEAQPLVVLEALAAGTPVLALRRGCLGEWSTRPGVDVVDDVDAFRSALAAAADDPSRWRGASDLARHTSAALRAEGVAELEAYLATIADLAAAAR